MKEKKNVPKLRFPEFSGEWEQHKLGDVLDLSIERNDGKYGTDDILAASLGTELQKKHLYFGLKATNESVRNYKIVYPGDIIYTKSPIKGFPNGIIRASKGVTGIVPTLYCVYHSVCSINPNIIQAYFDDKNRLDNYLTPLVNVGARNNVNITDKGFLEGLIIIPSDIKEQDRIADTIEAMSNLISLQQRKLDQIKEYKKGMLQKMFPKDGASVPEVRFPGFSGEWEQRKLGCLVSFSKGSGYSKGDLKEDGTPIILYGRLYTRYETVISDVDTFVDEKKGSVYSIGGEIIVPASGETAEEISIASVVAKPGILLGGDLNIISPSKELDSAFLAISISNGKPHNDMAKMAQGKSVVHLHNSDLSKIDLPYPSRDEQCKISGFFCKLDTLITLHQRKLDAMKEYKKGLLQQMFV